MNKPRIVCTGSEGFVGTHTVKVLEKEGYEVVHYDLKKGYDIRDRKQLLDTIEPGDRVLHLAAVARFAEADEDPLLAYETNVRGTENVAYAAGLKNADRLIYASTGSNYMPIEEEPPITESFKVRGNSVYACSKFMGEEYIKMYKVPYMFLRYSHLYGPLKEGHGAVGGFVARMKRGLSPLLMGGAQSNDMCYIKDVVVANIKALESDPKNLNEAYNIGTGEELTTREAFEIMQDVFGYHKELKVLPQRTVDPQRFVYDTTKAEKMLGFKFKWSFREGLEDFKDYYIKK